MGALLDDAAMAGIAWMLVRMQPHVPVLMEPRMKDRLYTAAVVVAPNGNARAVALEGAFSDDAVGTCGSQRVLFAIVQRERSACLHVWSLGKDHTHSAVDLDTMIPTCCKEFFHLTFDFTYSDSRISNGDELSIVLGVCLGYKSDFTGSYVIATVSPHSDNTKSTIHVLRLDLSKLASGPTHTSFSGERRPSFGFYPFLLIAFTGSINTQLPLFLWGGRLLLHSQNKDYNVLLLTDASTGDTKCEIRGMGQSGSSVFTLTDTAAVQYLYSAEQAYLWSFGKPDQQLAYTQLPAVWNPVRTSIFVPHLTSDPNALRAVGIGGGCFVTVRGESSPCLNVHNAYTAAVTDTVTSSPSLHLGSICLSRWL
ncbi:hypothetical protein Pelo_5631 [Pelomyxa schiedti]|nr:hypothetical protein Pelo_5631 [Pelomyxa schiedti]